MRKNEFPKLTYARNRRRKRNQSRWIIVIALLVFLGGSVYYVTNFLDTRKETQKQFVEDQSSPKEEYQPQVIGPYGMWMVEAVNQEKGMKEEVAKESADEEQSSFLQGFVDTREPRKVKGIYVSASKVNHELDKILTLVEEKEINAVVIDIKDDEGYITFPMDYEEATRINAIKNYMTDVTGLLKKLKEKDVYVIARLVAFKDPVLAEARTDLALKKKDGTLFRDKDGNGWVNPYKEEIWQYLIGVAKECAKIGFDEVNFDYVRFSTDSGMSSVDFGEEATNMSKMDAITGFVKVACEELKPLGIFVSADVYGAVIDSSVDAKIVGQDYVEMSRYLDYICPMIYPSHYGDGCYGIDHPDTQPYLLIQGALLASKLALEEIEEENRAIVRPWLQDFTASWLSHYIKYGAAEVRTQIDAVYDSGYEEWFLWNSSMRYTTDALLTSEEANIEFEKRKKEKQEEDLNLSTKETLMQESITIKAPTKVPGMEKHIDTPWKAKE